MFEASEVELPMDGINTQTVISGLSAKADVFRTGAHSYIPTPPLNHSVKFPEKPQACATHMASDLKCSGHRQMSTKCYEAYSSPPAIKHTSLLGTICWQYWGGQEQGKWYLISMKQISQVSRKLTISIFPPQSISVFLTWNSGITGTI